MAGFLASIQLVKYLRALAVKPSNTMYIVNKNCNEMGVRFPIKTFPCLDQSSNRETVSCEVSGGFYFSS